MNAERDRAIFLALAALSEVADSCDVEPVEPSLALRACLALLYAHSDGDRYVYDDFWRTLRRKLQANENPHTLAYVRPTNARSALMSIARSVGIELTVERWAKLRAVARKDRLDDKKR